MANVGTLTMSLLANASGFVSGVATAKGALNQFASQARTVTSGIAAQLTGALGFAGVTGAAGWGIKLAMEAETAQAAFTVLSGSAENAKTMLAELKAFSERNPVSLSALHDSSRTLLSFGVAADQVVPTMRRLAEISGGNSERLGSLALAFGQMSAAGRLMGQDLLQMINAGFNPLQTISKMTGESMAALKARMESGGISAKDVALAFEAATSAGGQFHGLLAAQAATTQGSLNKMTAAAQNLARSFGEAVSPMVTKFINGLTELVNKLNALDGATKSNIVRWGAYALAITGAVVVMQQIVRVGSQVMLTIQSLAKGQAILTALSGPKGWLQLLATGVAIWGAIDLVNEAFEETHGIVAKASAESSAMGAEQQKNYAEQLRQLRELGAATESVNPLDAEHDRLKKAFDRATEIVKQFRTPQEVFRDTATELQSLFDSGMIGAATFNRAMADAAEKLREARGDMEAIENMRKGVGAAVVGTTEGFSAVQEAMRNARADQALAAMRRRDERPNEPRERVLDRQHLAEQKRAADELAAIRRHVTSTPNAQPQFNVANF